MITWQKLIFDKDCCAQAFRLLLTKIKSSRRIGALTTSNSRRSVSSGVKQQPQHDDDNGEYADDGFEPEDGCTATDSPIPHQRVNFKTKLRSTVRKSTPVRSDDGGGWNFDVTTSIFEEEKPENNNNETHAEESRDRVSLPSLTASANLIADRRVTSTKQPTSFLAVNIKKNQQLQSLQHEKTFLAEENARLKEDVAHLEALTATLQNEISKAEPATTFDCRRMRLVQAQNMQLQRQVNLLQDAMVGIQQVETNLLVALNRVRDVVDTGVQEAKTAGAEQTGGSERGKDVKWMMAVPEALMSELNRIQTQLHSATAAISGAFESKLRVSGASSSFLRSSTTCLRAGEVFGTGQHQQFAHLRLDRLKLLEDKLVRLAKALDIYTNQVLHEDLPRLRPNDARREPSSDVSALLDVTRHVLLELGALGAVVSIARPAHPSGGSENADAEDPITVMQVYKVFVSASNGKEREKNLKSMMNQLHARHVAMENEMHACRRETKYWRRAWQSQEEIVSLLAKRVSHLGEKKIQWCQANVSEPLTQITQVFESFQRAQQEGTSRQNPYLPLLVETLENEQCLLVDSLDQWRSYSSSVEAKLNNLFDDYEANRVVLLGHDLEKLHQ